MSTAFWARLDGVDRPTLWALIDSAPALVCKAYEHAGRLPNLGDFWMKKMDAAKQKDRIDRLMEVVYHKAVWSDKPEDVNTLALNLTRQAELPWLKLFHIGQLIQIRETLKHKAGFNKISFKPRAGWRSRIRNPAKTKHWESGFATRVTMSPT